MSYDRAIDYACPHIVVDEALFVNGDRQTVRPIRPISSFTSVKVRLNGIVECPSEGVYLPPQTIGTRKGPFNIQGGVNNVFQLSVNNEPVQTATLPSSQLMPTVELLDRLNTQLQGAWFFLSDRNTVGVRSAYEGKSATLFVYAGSTLAPTLGMTVNREYRGQDLVSGWTLVTDTNTLADRPTRLVVFDRPLRSTGDYVEISYATLKEECRRCGGSGYEHDWRFNTRGELETVQNEQLLVQEIQKILYTERGSNPFHIWYGTDLIQSVGKNLVPGGALQNLVVSDIYDAFSQWQSIKQQQENRVGQLVTDQEYPMRLLGVALAPSQTDQTVMYVSTRIQNRAGTAITLERGIRTRGDVGTIQGSTQNFTLTG
jgi:phage baseplate assembly protein W